MTTRIQSIDYSVDLLQVILWQYNDAVNIQGLLQQKQAWIDANQSAFWSNWLTDVFDLRTANDFGLAVWAIILDLPLFITGGVTPSKPTFGFGAFNQNFNRGNFFGSSSNTLPLTTAQKRLILQLRYYQLVTSGCVPEINAFLAYLFGSFGRVYVLDNYDMTCTYVFTFEPAAQLRQALLAYDVLPRPAGVGIGIITPSMRIFGLDVENDLYAGLGESVWGN